MQAVQRTKGQVNRNGTCTKEGALAGDRHQKRHIGIQPFSCSSLLSSLLVCRTGDNAAQVPQVMVKGVDLCQARSYPITLYRENSIHPKLTLIGQKSPKFVRWSDNFESAG